MDIKELRDKSTAELNRLLKEMRDRLRALRFKLASRQLANVREIRKVRQIIARVLTVLESRKDEKQGGGKAKEEAASPVEEAKS